MKNQQIRLGLFGGSGKMGLAVEEVLLKEGLKSNIIPYLTIGKNFSKKPSSLFAISAENINVIEQEILEDVDVWIDFSSAQGLKELLAATKKNKSAVVSGSTGLTEKDFKNLKNNAKNKKIFWASNLSPGLWAFRQAMKNLQLVSHFDFAIEEVHHNQKKDAPSGTAKTLHADLKKITNKNISTPTSLRLGGVFGVHNVIGASNNEVITLSHQALNRTVFAEGAVMAAKWITNKKNGLYSMEHLFS